MEAYELDKIKVLATSFRGAIEIAKDAGEFDNDFAFPRFPKGCCGDTSDLLAEYLAQHDIYTYYVCGQKGTQSHAWLVLVNTVTVTTDNSDADRKYKSLISVYNEDNDVIIKNHHVAEDGETFDDLFARTGSFLKEVVQPQLDAGKDVIIVGHGAMDSSIVCQVQNIPLEKFWDAGIENCKLMKLL